MSEQPLASSEVSLSIDFDNLDEELKRGLQAKVKKAAAEAERNLDKVGKAGREAGEDIDAGVGGGAAAAARKVKRAARQAEADLAKVAAAAEAAGAAVDDIGDGARGARSGLRGAVAEMVRAEAAARKAAAAVQTIRQGLDEPQGALFDLDQGSIVEVQRDLKGVQAALFDLDSVPIDRIETSAGRASRTLRERLSPALLGVRDRLRSLIEGRGAGALDDLGRKAEGLGRSADKSGISLDRYTGRLSLLASAISLAAAAAPPLIAAGAGVSAAIALSVPSIAQVVKGTKDMADAWDGLTDEQKIATAATARAAEVFKATSAAIEPRTLQVYNGVLAETIRLLPRVQPIAENAADALTAATQTLGQGLDSPRARDFFEFLQTNAGPAIDQVTGLLMDAAGASVSLVEAIAPLASTAIGLVGGLARLVTVLNDINPGFAQLAVTAIALRSPLAAAQNLLGKGAGKAASFASSAGKAGAAAKLLNKIAGAGPNIYLAAGTAIAFFAIKTLTAKRAIDSTIDSINAQNKAFGNNVAGYEAANKALASKLVPVQQQLAAAQTRVTKATTATNIALAQGALALDDFQGSPLRAAMDANAASIKRVDEAARQLAAAGFAPTIAAARELADAAGVNLSKALDENGQVSGSATARIALYSSSIRTASDTTAVLADAWSRAKNEALGLTAQTQALQDVFNRFLNPSLALLDANNRLREVQGQVNKAFREGNVTSLQRQQFLSQEIAALRDKLTAEQQATGATRAATAETLKLLPALSRLAGNSDVGRKAVYNLARSLDGARQDASGAITVIDDFGHAVRVLPNGKIVKIKADTAQAEGALHRFLSLINAVPQQKTVGVLATGATGGLAVPGAIVRLAAGGAPKRPRGRVSGPGTSTSDDVFALLSRDEFVVNARATRRWLPLLAAINAGRLARGGLAGAAAAALPRFAGGGRVKVDPNAHRIAVALGIDISPQLEKALAKRLQTIGTNLGRQFTSSLLGTPSQISSTLRGLEKQVTKAFAGIKTRVDNQLVARLERLNTRLTGLAKQRDKIIQAIEDAQQFATNTTAEARRFASLAGFGDAERSTGVSIEKTLKDRLARIKSFAADIKALGARGLDKSVIQQLVEAGPDEGADLARTLRQASSTTLREITRTQREINSATSRLGRDTADLLFDSGKQAARGFLAGLKAQQKEIVSLMTDIAESVSKTVKKTLKIKSPSRVLEDDAVNAALGFIRGWQRLRERIQTQVATAVRPGRQVERASALVPNRQTVADRARTAATGATAAARQLVVNQTNHIHNVTDPNAIASIVEGRLVAALR
ncbi:hypothetical protein JOL79_06950 [Microbispora sp. RL4-1S]|uniref:Uncharacterized protein n=1 Tax=Microbispora oryzae TaxID=2806554 RepID=A0A940WM06_9ACTN|nr:hypothetical protein [Microbispora oryzae]MBP2703536.1 hypothetical protein [Microbispora oryzae]